MTLADQEEIGIQRTDKEASQAACDILKADNERLRAALRDIVEAWNGPREKAALTYTHLENAKNALTGR